MNNEEKDIEFIEKYLEGLLTEEEKQDFEERLSVDEKFEERYYSYKTLIEGIGYSGRKKLLQNLKKIEASISAQESYNKRILGVPTKHFYSYSAAATIVLLITFTFVFFLNHKNSSQELFAEYYAPYPNVLNPTTRGSQENTNDKDLAFAYYDQEQYEKAIEYFEKVHQNEKTAGILLYLGNSYLAISKFDSAITKFIAVQKIDETFKIQAQWYLAMSYLGNNQEDKAIEVLEEIKNQNVSYSAKAESILKKLK